MGGIWPRRNYFVGEREGGMERGVGRWVGKGRVG
jgi:hypothetical protein